MKVKLIAAGCLLATAVAGWVVNSETTYPVTLHNGYVEFWPTGDITVVLEPEYWGWGYLHTQVERPWSPSDEGCVPTSEIDQQPLAGYPAEWHPNFSWEHKPLPAVLPRIGD